MELQDIVYDWGGFEELIKDLHASGDVSVERNVTLLGKSGASRQIDVLLIHKKGPYQYKTIVECKYWSKKVGRADIDVLYSSMLDLNVSKGVMFSVKGFQSGAEIYARGIDIFIVRDLTDKEWGSPGKIIDFYLHIIHKTILNVSFCDTKAGVLRGTAPEINNNIYINFRSQNQHLVVSKHKEKHRTLEDYLEAASNHAVKELQKKSFILNHGENYIRYFSTIINMQFDDQDLRILNGNKVVFIPKIVLTVGIRINQSRLIFDRSQRFIYALAVEDCVNQQVYATYKNDRDTETQWVKLSKNAEEREKDLLVNGSVLQVVMKDFFDPKEIYGLKEVAFTKTSNK